MKKKWFGGGSFGRDLHGTLSKHMVMKTSKALDYIFAQRPSFATVQ